MTFYSTLEKYHYQMKEGRFVMEVTASKVKVLWVLQILCKCVQVDWHKSPVPSTFITACVVGYTLTACAEGVHTGRGYWRNTLLVFYCILFFMLLLHQVTGIITFSGMPYNASLPPPPLFFPFVSFFILFWLWVFFPYWLVSGKVICFMACSSCVCVCV